MSRWRSDERAGRPHEKPTPPEVLDWWKQVRSIYATRKRAQRTQAERAAKVAEIVEINEIAAEHERELNARRNEILL